MKISNISHREFLPKTFFFLLFAICCFSINITSAQHSGEDMFRAVFFGEGRAASVIPELQGMSIDNFTNSKKEITDTRQMQDQLVSNVNQTNPRLFGEFEEVMTSGNHVSIKNKLNEAKSILNKAASRTGHKRNTEFEARLTKEVMAQLPKGVSFETTNQALMDYFQQQEGNSEATQACGGYIHHYFIAFIMMAYEWYWDPAEEFSINYQDRLVNSIAEKW